jgi:hypothetical protein
MSESLEGRVALARRCAWCLRFWIAGRWMLGRRADDEGVAPIATHTICDGCLETLRASGILGKEGGARPG